ncbi:hypothetical protein BT96DRAFT_761080, partial [Gymnopus androsaceus JB14]
EQEVLNMIWQQNFNTQHKLIGEHHQRHHCHPVCFKGHKNKTECRFGYPHELVELSCFKVESNSVIFARKELDMNGHNPYVLVFGRHNHDHKCILSGKAAKA